MKPHGTFGEVCEGSHLKRAKAHEAHHKAIVEDEEKDPIIELLDKVLEKTRKAANLAVVAFQKQSKEALVPCVPAEYLLILVSRTYSTVSQFRLTIWRMVADECIMPLRHDYLTNMGLATVMQHALEKIQNTCVRIVLPRPPEPKDDLTALFDSLWNSTSVSRMLMAPAMAPPVPFSSVPPIPCALHTGGLDVGPVPATTAPVFGGAPLTPIAIGIATGVSLFPSSALPPGFAPRLTSVAVPSTSSAPAAASMPKVSGNGIVLPISIPLQGHPGGRPDFLTDPIQGGSMDIDEEAETMVDEDLRKMARDIF